MSWLSETWQSIQPTVIVITTSVVTSFITSLGAMALQRRADRNAAAEKERLERLDPVLNVRREMVSSQSITGTRTYTRWLVNPFFVEADQAGQHQVRGWPGYALQEEKILGGDGYGGRVGEWVPLTAEEIDAARERKAWLQFSEAGETLSLVRSVPCTHEDAYLFKPLPRK